MSRAAEKLVSRDEALLRRESARSRGLVVGYTSGVFDLLHPGHVEYLERARELCDFLIVGVNSDSSVRRIKGDLRPILPEDARARVVAALASVDLVFCFSESNNNQNVSLLKPDLYIKAGDYSAKTLSSKPLVEQYGGRVELVSLEEGFSSSRIISKVLENYSAHGCIRDSLPPWEPAPAIFVDRDGTVIEHVSYLSDPEKVQIIPGALEALKTLKNHGYRIILVTNQPGVGLGYFTYEQLYAVNSKLFSAAKKAGFTFDRVYFAPAAEGVGSSWRKPEPGMLLQAATDLNVQLDQSVMIGDSTADIAAGRRAGCFTVLVKTGRGGDDRYYETVPDVVVSDVGAAVPHIIERRNA